MNTDLLETFEEYQESLRRAAESAPLESNEHWRLSSLYRHVRTLSTCTSWADCGALLREILRLQGWVSRIPAAGFPISQPDWKLLDRFGIPLIFLPISTLNYVGVPRKKFNQVSGISNFTRNVGGAVGVSVLNTFVARQGQVHRVALTAHANHANPFFERQLAGMVQNLKATGMGAAEASHRALAQFSQQVDLHSSVLSYVNAFWLMGAAVLLLVPLPFLMRRPSAGEMKEPAPAH